MSKEKKHVNVSAAVNITLSTDITGEVYHLSYEEAKALYDELDKFFGADKDKCDSKEDTAQKNTHLPENPYFPENPYLPENPFPEHPWSRSPVWNYLSRPRDPLDFSWSGIGYHFPFEGKITTTTTKG